MRLVPPPLEIGERDGFTGTDLFGYEPFGTDLARLVESLEGPSVIALDGGWGSGKTVFARQWAGLLRKRGSAVIYLDAFAADTGDDPLFDIASQLFAAAPDGAARIKFAGAAAVLGQRLMPLVAGTGLRLMTAGLFGQDELIQVASAFADAKKAATGEGQDVSEVFRRRVEGAKDRADALCDFRKSLTELAGSIREGALSSAEHSVESPEPRPLVVIVDELDRCKPTYALSVLENLKHVFSIENICFVLVTNQEQLGRVVGREYGVSHEREYLDKFIQATFRLPTDVALTGHSVRKTYIDRMFQEMATPRHLPGITESTVTISDAVGLSLRAIEKVITNVAMCTGTHVMSGFCINSAYSAIIPVSICVLKAKAPDHYARLRTSDLSAETVMEYLSVAQWPIRQEKVNEYSEMFLKYFPPQDAIDGNIEAMRGWRSGFAYEEVRNLCRCLDRFGQN